MDRNAYSWLITNHKLWNKKREQFGSLDEFADYLGVDKGKFNLWIKREGNPDVNEALLMCKQTWDFSLMDNLGYLDDIYLNNMEDKSVEYVLRLRTATFEGKKIVKELKLDAKGREAEKEEVLTRIFSSYNFRKSGKMPIK